MDNKYVYSQRAVKSSNVWLTFLFLGWSYGSLGEMGKQILFYITLGGLGIWTLVRFFTLSDSIKNYNRNIARECGLTDSEMAMVGL